jgi:AraC-like DNA-binding protein
MRWGMNTTFYPLDGTLEQDILCLHHQDNEHNSPFHQHENHFELFCFISGNVTFFTKKTAYTMKRGYLVAIPPGQGHRAKTNDNSMYNRVFINIKVDIADKLSTSKTDLTECFYDKGKDIVIQKLNEKELEQFINLCNDVIALGDSDQYGIDVKRNIILSKILLLANKADGLKKEKNIIPSLLERLTRYIDIHLSGDLSLSVISSDFYLNSAYLNRYFKSYMGISLHRYIISKRIEMAKKYLKQGETVTRVCEICGFGNYSNFIRTFKKYVGVSPGKYMNRR